MERSRYSSSPLRSAAASAGETNDSNPAVTVSLVACSSPSRSDASFSCAANGSRSKSWMSSTLSCPMSVKKSRSGGPYGAMDAREATAHTRSGNSAAHANACGPPPEMPHTAMRS